MEEEFLTRLINEDDDFEDDNWNDDTDDDDAKKDDDDDDDVVEGEEQTLKVKIKTKNPLNGGFLVYFAGHASGLAFFTFLYL